MVSSRGPSVAHRSTLIVHRRQISDQALRIDDGELGFRLSKLTAVLLR